jgi:tetratricopeptide (TPR) repeat protein
VSTPPADDQRAALEAEREFLVRSLDDLDAERAAGNIDDETYATLHADYTARAAAVLRRLRDGVDLSAPATPKARGPRRWLPVAAIVLFAAAVALLLAQTVRDREPGGALTGNDVGATATTVDAAANLEALGRAARERPDDYNARIALARVLLGTDLQRAVTEFDAAAQLAPRQPEPLAYGGWIRSLVARQLRPGEDRDLLLDAAFDRFARAIEARPAYPDTFVFRGLTRMQVLGDAEAAVPDFQRFLQLAPADHPQRALVLGALERAVTATGSSTTVPAAPAPTSPPPTDP